MKKLISMLLALSLVVCMTALSSCGDDDGGEDTSTSTEEDTAAKNEVAYDWETINGGFEPASCWFLWGAPDSESQYFVIDADHVIHDGKGSWGDYESTSALYAFDGGEEGMSTFYDCDEYLEYQTDTSDAEFGIVLYEKGLGEDWRSDDIDADGKLIHTGYVGAWIEEGVVLHQLRYCPRPDNALRMVGGYFEASADGETWVTLYTIEEEPTGLDFELVDVDDDTVYYYVRYVCETGCYCNIAEFEIWGVAGTAE